MVFVNFHNMKEEKKFSNVTFKLKQTQKIFTLQQVKTILQSQFNKCSVFFSSFFKLCTVYLKLKMSRPFFLSFSHMLCSTMFKFLFFFISSLFFFSIFHCPVAFCFCFGFHFFLFFFPFLFFIINCSFNVPFCFSNLISTSLSLP